MKLGPGAFVDTLQQFTTFLKAQGAIPTPSNATVVTLKQVTDTQPSQVNQGTEDYKVVGGGDQAFPTEYAVSGWFKWAGDYVADFHFIFRLTINGK